MELLESARQGNAAEVISLLEEPQSPDQEEDGDPVAQGSTFFLGVCFGGVFVVVSLLFFLFWRGSLQSDVFEGSSLETQLPTWLPCGFIGTSRLR